MAIMKQVVISDCESVPVHKVFKGSLNMIVASRSLWASV